MGNLKMHPYEWVDDVAGTYAKTAEALYLNHPTYFWNFFKGPRFWTWKLRWFNCVRVTCPASPPYFNVIYRELRKPCDSTVSAFVYEIHLLTYLILLLHRLVSWSVKHWFVFVKCPKLSEAGTMFSKGYYVFWLRKCLVLLRQLQLWFRGSKEWLHAQKTRGRSADRKFWAKWVSMLLAWCWLVSRVRSRH